jgi:hypothetical protein
MTICVIDGKNSLGKFATTGSRRQQASGLCSPDAEGFISRFVSIRVD